MACPRWFAILATLILAVAGACTSPTEPYRQLQVTLTTSDSVLRLGESLDVTVAVVNRGASSVTIAANGCPETFIVTTVSGDIVGPGERICSLAALRRELAPGDQHLFRYTYRGDARQGRITDAPVALPPGEYVLRAYVGAEGGAAESAAVRIEIQT